MTVTVRRLERLEEVHALEPMLRDYVRFLTGELIRGFGVSFDPDQLLAKTRASLANVIPPEGFTFVAEGREARRLGMVFLRSSGPEAMEIKRLYVRPDERGRGIGKLLITAAISAARDTGAAALRLDTTRNLEAAIGLYRSMGFEDTDPYVESDHFDDPVLGAHILFMSRPL
ncbi:MAG: GNAT family N-acetyltransferase [Silicimonas sp.]|nr:GNAT family N-acetyltransferase [Silicimonas sp.]